jgi:thiosulfate dehydrogenase (quinone) large subunit
MLELLQRKQKRVIKDPNFVKFLFTDVRMSVLWLIARVWLGYQWWNAGIYKLDSESWMVTGAALRGYWTGAVAIPEGGRPPIAFDWYRSFIQSLLDAEAYVWFSKLIVYGEILVGLALIVGAFVGISAFFGALMNFNFMMAGSASTNPVLFLIAILLIFAWKVAGFIGADYYLLNLIGTPWGWGKFEEDEVPEKQYAAAVGD